MEAYCGDCQSTLDVLAVRCALCRSEVPERGWARDMFLGITIGGKFRINGRLSGSSLGVLYEALDTDENKLVLVRTLHSRYHSDKQMVGEFSSQSETIRTLTSVHTARVLAIVKEPGVVGYVTEHPWGVSLQDLLDAGRTFDAQSALIIANQVADSLADAHGKGVVHRGLNPAQIIVYEPDGQDQPAEVTVVGYGLTAVRQHSAASNLRMSDRSPAYMAPEQVNQEGVSSATDLYSLGAILFHMLAGRPPFSDPDPMVVLRARVEEPAPGLNTVAADVDAGVARIVDRLLETDPARRRPDSAQALAEKLNLGVLRLGFGYPPTERSVTEAMRDSIHMVFPKQKKLSKTLGPVVWGTLGGVVLGVALAAASVLSSPESTPMPRHPERPPQTAPTGAAESADPSGRAPSAAEAGLAAPNDPPQIANAAAQPNGPGSNDARAPTGGPAAGATGAPVAGPAGGRVSGATGGASRGPVAGATDAAPRGGEGGATGAAPNAPAAAPALAKNGAAAPNGVAPAAVGTTAALPLRGARGGVVPSVAPSGVLPKAGAAFANGAGVVAGSSDSPPVRVPSGSDPGARFSGVAKTPPAPIPAGQPDASTPPGLAAVAPTARRLLPSGAAPVVRLGHRGVVRAVACSADGKWLVTASDDGAVRVSSADTLEAGRELTGLPLAASALAVSRHAGLVVAGTAQGHLVAWDSNSDVGRQVGTYGGGVLAVSVGPLGKEVLVADRRRMLSRVSAQTWRPIGRSKKLGAGGPSYAAAISGDGGTIVVVNGGPDPKMIPRNTRTHKAAIQLDAIDNVIRVVTGYHGRWLVSGSSSGAIQIAALGKATTVKTVQHGEPLTSLAMHPTRPLFASGGVTGTITLWHAETGVGRRVVGSTVRSSVTALSWAPTGQQLLVATADRSIARVDTARAAVTDRLLAAPPGAPLLAFTHDGKQLVVAGQDGFVHLWDLATGTRSGGFRTTAPAAVSVKRVGSGVPNVVLAGVDGFLRSFASDAVRWQVNARGTFGAVTLSETELAVALRSGGQIRRFQLLDGAEIDVPVGKAQDKLRIASYAPDGHRLAVGSAGGAVAVYDLSQATPRKTGRLSRGRGEVIALRWSADGGVLAAAFDGGGLLAYSREGKRTRAIVLQRSGDFPTPALALIDGTLIAGSRSGAVRSWGWRDASSHGAPSEHGATSGWAVSGNGRVAAVADRAGRVSVGRFGTGGLGTLSLFVSTDAWLGWTADGNYVANAAGKTFLRIRVGRELRPVSAFPGLENTAAIQAAVSRL